MPAYPLGTKRVVAALIFLAMATIARAEIPSTAAAISIVASPDAKGIPDSSRAALAFDLAQSALARPHEAHPRVVLMYVNQETARTQGVPKKTDVVVLHLHDSDPSSYFVYLVGEPTDERLAVAVVCVLNREWELKLTKKQIDQAAYRVRLGLMGVISARDLAKQEDLRTSR